MPRSRELPIALTIAGSDSGGGAGIQADLKTFAALKVHGTCAITCVTAQNPKGVLGVQPCTPKIIRQQISAVLAELPPAAIKTGMLFSAAIIETVADLLHYPKRPALIVDPVMVATSGSRLLRTSAIRALERRLLPIATVVTPNVDEAAVLSGLKARSPEDLRSIARRIHSRYGCAVLVKGGHLAGMRQAIDIFYDGATEFLLEAPYVRGISTHGTGCTYSAAIAAILARGNPLKDALLHAKKYITQAIAESHTVAGHTVLSHSSSDSQR